MLIAQAFVKSRKVCKSDCGKVMFICLNYAKE